MKYSSRFFLYAPITLFLLLTAWVAVHWWNAATAFDKQLAALKGHDVMPGVTADWSKVTLSGFPFRIDAVFDGFKLAGAGAHGPFTWNSEHFALHALTYGVPKDVFEAAGNQTLNWTDAAGATHAISFLPGALHASAVRDSKGLARFDADAVDVVGARFLAGRLQFHLRRDPDADALDIMISADLVEAKDGMPGFGKALRTLRVYETLDHRAALAPLLAGSVRWPDAASAWQAAGGAVKPGKQEITLRTRETPRVLMPEEAKAVDALLGALY